MTVLPADAETETAVLRGRSEIEVEDDDDADDDDGFMEKDLRGLGTLSTSNNACADAAEDESEE